MTSNVVDLKSERSFYRAAVDNGRAGRLNDAGLILARAWRAAPNQPRSAAGLLECASRLATSGLRPAPRKSAENRPRAKGMISFVICSVTPSKLSRLAADIFRVFLHEEYEIIHIRDAKSLCEGYMRGLRRARGELLVFCHDDVGIINDDFAVRLREQLAQFDIIGLAGTQKLEGPAWHWGGPLTTAARVALPNRNGDLTAVLLGTDVGAMRHVQAVDGVFIAGRRHVFEKVPFDADTFDGFHFYDIDQSYRSHLAGFTCGVALDLFIWHESGGNFNEDWRRYAERFISKFPIATPTRIGAPYRPGIWRVEPRWISAMYAWVDHWLTVAHSAANG